MGEVSEVEPVIKETSTQVPREVIMHFECMDLIRMEEETASPGGPPQQKQEVLRVPGYKVIDLFLIFGLLLSTG